MNVPLGSRTLCIQLRSFVNGDWYAEARQLWPFQAATATIAYAWMENTAVTSADPHQFTFHFVLSYRNRFHQRPVLVQQAIYAIEDSVSHTETWAIELDTNLRPEQIPSALHGFRWWHTQMTSQPRVHLRYPFRQIQAGAMVEITMYTHRRLNVAMFLLQDRRTGADTLEDEQVSLLQTQIEAHRPHKAIEILAESFDEICKAIMIDSDRPHPKPEGNVNLRTDEGIAANSHKCSRQALALEMQTFEPESDEQPISSDEDDLTDHHTRTDSFDSQVHAGDDQTTEDWLPSQEIEISLKALQAFKQPQKVKLTGPPVQILLQSCLSWTKTTAFDEEEISLQWFERRNWFDFCIKQPQLLTHPIPDGTKVKPSTYHMLTRRSEWTAIPNTYLIYIDGSATNHTAAWSIVIVATDGWTQTLVGAAYGQVCTDSTSDRWIGAAQADNVAAELTALLFAQNWIFKRNDEARYVILPDLQLSKMLARNEAICRVHPLLVRLVRVYAEWIQDRCQYVHVKGHAHFAWNELADSIAVQAMKHRLESVGNVMPDMHQLASNVHDLKWVWMQDSTDSMSKCFPVLVDEQAVSFGHSLQRVSIPTEDTSPPIETVQVSLTALTANVLALDTKEHEMPVGRSNAQRTIRLDQQWNDLQCHIAGLQEARTPAGQFQSENYIIVSSGADYSHTATHGCELWIHKTLRLAQTQTSQGIKLANSKIVVQHASPRRLFVQLEQEAFQLNAVVLHAPCKKVGADPDHECDQWWDETAALFHNLVGNQQALVLVDANAPLATCESAHIGLAGAEKMNPAGHAFETFIMSTGLFAPTTMTWCHHGQHATWTHPKGAKCRRDYILVTESLYGMTLRTEVLTDHDTTFSHEDHLPVAIVCKGLLPLAPPKKNWKWDFDKMKDPEVCRQFQEALSTLPLPVWNIHVDDHCALYEKQLLQIGQQFFQKSGKSKSKPPLQQTTIDAIQLKRSCLNLGRVTGEIRQEDFRKELKELEKQIKKLVYADIRAFYDTMLSDLEQDSQIGDFRAVYKALTRFGSKKSKQASKGRPLPLLEKADGTFAKSFQEFQEVWLQQFAEVEAGEPVAWDTLCQQNRRGLGIPAGEHDPQIFPDEMNLCNAISRLKRGKVPGPNQIPTDLMRAGQPVIARHLTALMMKSAGHSKEPITWRGGFVTPLYKRGPMAKPSSYRSIFLSDVTAKLYHSAIREHLLTAWQDAMTHQQLGGRPNCGTDSAHHWVQAHNQWTTFHKLGAGYVFFDLKSAFYTVIRQTLTDLPDDDNSVFTALVRLGIRPDEVHRMLQQAGDRSATQGISRHASKIVKDLMSNTYFKMRHTDTVVRTHRGTRPGDPIADLLFNMCMRLILEDVVQLVSQRSDAEWIGDTKECSDFSQSRPLPPLAYFDVSYVDDMVFALHGSTNSEVECLAKIVVESVCQSAARRGLMVNFDPGKTEMIWNIRGPGTRQTKCQLAQQSQKLCWNGDEGQSFELRIVPAYKHLGTWLQTGGKHGKEIKSRQAAATSSWGPLTRSFYAKKQVAQSTKVKVFQSLSLSRHTYNAHTWCGVTQTQLQQWQNTIRKPLASIVRPRLQGLPHFKFDVETLAGLAHMLTPLDMLHVSRLRYLKRMLTNCSETLWNMIWDARGMQESWVDHCRDSFAWLCKYCPTQLAVNQESDFNEWVVAIMLDNCWRGKIKAAVRSCTDFRHENAKQQVWQVKFEETLAQTGVQSQAAQLSQVDSTWQCDLCHQEFASKCALSMHAHKVHGYRMLLRYYALGDTCHACNKLYHCRARFRTHLATSHKCLHVLQACFPPCSNEIAQQVDDEDKIQNRQLKDNGWWATKAFLPPLPNQTPQRLRS